MSASKDRQTGVACPAGDTQDVPTLELDPRIDGFLEYFAGVRRMSVHTCRAYASDLRQLSSFLASRSVDLDDVAPTHVRAFMSSLFGVNDPRSMARKLASVRAYYTWRVSTGALARNPARLVRPPKQRKPLPGALDTADAAAVMDATVDGPAWRQTRDTAMVELAYGAGLRASEICSLRLDAIRLTTHEVTVIGKGRKTRIAVFGQPAEQAIRIWLEDRSRVALPATAQLFVGHEGAD